MSYDPIFDQLSFRRFILSTALSKLTPLYEREGVKKLAPFQRAGRDVVKVLQRYLFTLTTDDEKL
jgi:hypothetical protein